MTGAKLEEPPGLRTEQNRFSAPQGSYNSITYPPKHELPSSQSAQTRPNQGREIDFQPRVADLRAEFLPNGILLLGGARSCFSTITTNDAVIPFAVRVSILVGPDSRLTLYQPLKGLRTEANITTPDNRQPVALEGITDIEDDGPDAAAVLEEEIQDSDSDADGVMSSVLEDEASGTEVVFLAETDEDDTFAVAAKPINAEDEFDPTNGTDASDMFGEAPEIALAEAADIDDTAADLDGSKNFLLELGEAEDSSEILAGIVADQEDGDPEAALVFSPGEIEASDEREEGAEVETAKVQDEEDGDSTAILAAIVADQEDEDPEAALVFSPGEIEASDEREEGAEVETAKAQDEEDGDSTAILAAIVADQEDGDPEAALVFSPGEIEASDEREEGAEVETAKAQDEEDGDSTAILAAIVADQEDGDPEAALVFSPGEIEASDEREEGAEVETAKAQDEEDGDSTAILAAIVADQEDGDPEAALVFEPSDGIDEDGEVEMANAAKEDEKDEDDADGPEAAAELDAKEEVKDPDLVRLSSDEVVDNEGDLEDGTVIVATKETELEALLAAIATDSARFESSEVLAEELLEELVGISDPEQIMLHSQLANLKLRKKLGLLGSDLEEMIALLKDILGYPQETRSRLLKALGLTAQELNEIRMLVAINNAQITMADLSRVSESLEA